MHCQPQPQAQPRLASAGRPKAGRRRYKTFMIDEILSKETCDYFEKLSLYSVCPSLLVRPKPLHSCAGKHRKSPRTLPPPRGRGAEQPPCRCVGAAGLRAKPLLPRWGQPSPARPAPPKRRRPSRQTLSLPRPPGFSRPGPDGFAFAPAVFQGRGKMACVKARGPPLLISVCGGGIRLSSPSGCSRINNRWK